MQPWARLAALLRAKQHSRRWPRRVASWPNGSVIVPVMAEPIYEVQPGVLHWTGRHPTARLESGSHYLVEEGILIDPIAPPEGLEWFDGKEIGEILLTNRHHTRSAFDLQDRLGSRSARRRRGCTSCPSTGAAIRLRRRAERRHPAHAISETWPDEAALEIPRHRAVAIADGVIDDDGLGFFADFLLGDDPRKATPTRRLREARHRGRLRPSPARPRDADPRRRPRAAQPLRRRLARATRADGERRLSAAGPPGVTS